MHCDVLAAAIKSLKKSKAVAYEGRAQRRSNRSALRRVSRVSRRLVPCAEMLLMPMNKDVEVELVDKDFDPFA